MRKPDLVYEDIKGIHEKTGVRFFLFWDSLAPPKTLRTVAEGIKRDNLDVFWFAETKFEKPYVKHELIETLYEGGGRFLQFGFESGSQRVLDLIDKGNDLARVDTILENMHDVGLKAGVSWFIGFPGETPAEANVTYDFVQQRRDRIAISVYAGTFMLGHDTLVFADPDRYGIDIVRSETGAWDYKYKDGSSYYDRMPLHEGFRARSDLPLLCHGAYLLYATNKVDELETVTGLGRFGPLAKEMIDDDDIVLTRNSTFTLAHFNFNPLAELQQGQAVVERDPTEIMLLLKNGDSYMLDDEDRALVELVDGQRNMGAIVAAAGGDANEMRDRLGRLINRSIVLAPRDSAAAPAATTAPATSAA
jgi:hypothetical protein